jgi:hypothetical protein
MVNVSHYWKDFRHAQVYARARYPFVPWRFRYERCYVRRLCGDALNGLLSLRGGMPIRVNGQVVGAIGIAGMNSVIDTKIATAAAQQVEAEGGVLALTL